MSERDRELVQRSLPTYELVGELGRGAFGIVYEARHSQLGRQVAVKQLGRAFATDDTARDRFVAEAQMVARLDHPHIVPVYDFVDGEDGLCLIIMERLAGSVGDRFTSSGLETDAACAAILACCAALDFAHRADILHRDIKPENLLYDTKGVVKLGDFGIARALDTDARRTATGTVIGTPAYMSPEQVRGDDLGPASDIYSVGVMAYELLSGRFPFDEISSATGLLAHHLVTPPTPLLRARPEVPSSIGQVIDRALSKELAERQSSALELATELTSACVSAFGAGWLREGGFTIHWPEVIAVSERQTGGGSRTETIVVRADESRTVLAGVPGAAIGRSESSAPPSGGRPLNSGDVQYKPPTSPGLRPPQIDTGGQPAMAGNTRAAGGPPPAGPNAAASPGLPAPPAQQAGAPPPRPGEPAPQGLAGAPYAAPATTGQAQGGSRALLLMALGFGGFVVVALVALVAISLLSGGDDDQVAGDGTLTNAGTSAAGSASDSGNDPTLSGGDVTEFSPPVTPVPTEAREVIADTPFTPTPCPIEPERVACLTAVAVDDEGEMIAVYESFGFVPELEPVDYHLHFYLDTVVAGDERKAGTEEPGGSWRPWDGFLPFTSSGGENGRIGYTQADVEAAGARHLCVIVADPEQRAIPGTGNCAPIPYIWDDNVALEQVSRLTGVYAGRCAIGATVIMPEGWQWVDLVATSPEEAARILRPTNVATITPLYQDFVDSGGLLLGDGPVDGDYIVNFTVWRIEGNFTAADTPSEVEAELRRAGFSFDNPPTAKTLGGRDLNTQVVVGDGFEFTQYVVPDFGYALVLDFFSPNAAEWADTSDAVAATLMGC